MAVISKELVEKYESEGKRIIRIAPDWDVEEVCFDFEWWNERGLEYAQQLREALPDKYVLFYEYAAEDLMNRWKPAVLIEKK